MIQFSDRSGSRPLTGDALIAFACEQMRRGFAPPREIYQVEYRDRVDWAELPAWARPVDPQMFDGCCHEG